MQCGSYLAPIWYLLVRIRCLASWSKGLCGARVHEPIGYGKESWWVLVGLWERIMVGSAISSFHNLLQSIARGYNGKGIGEKVREWWGKGKGKGREWVEDA